MFDTLTLDQLYDLHTKLAAEHTARHHQLMSMPDALADAWQVLAVKQDETSETMDAVYAEIARREQEANADA